MSAWHAFEVVTLVLVLVDLFRTDWIVRRLDKLERPTTSESPYLERPE